jgi:hypothetical protein
VSSEYVFFCAQFGALEAVITGVLDEYPWMRKKREIFVACLMIYCFLGSLTTSTYVRIQCIHVAT